jgi:type II secretory pathway pseudopilin PulG
MKQSGVSMFEAIVVVAILLITSAFLVPGIGDWRSKRSLEADYLALLSQIDFIKTRVRTINGTGVLICNTTGNISYQISSTPQSSTSVVGAGFSNSLLEDPSSKDINFNILASGSTLVGPLCSGKRGIFLSSGMVGVEGGGLLDLELNRGGARNNVGAYRIVVNQSTGFVQKYRWKQASNAWLEQD